MTDNPAIIFLFIMMLVGFVIVVLCCVGISNQLSSIKLLLQDIRRGSERSNRRFDLRVNTLIDAFGLLKDTPEDPTIKNDPKDSDDHRIIRP